mgnify:CR=1 FL=1
MPIHHSAGSIQVSPRLLATAGLGPGEALAALGSSPSGLSSSEAAARRLQHGPNETSAEAADGWPRRLWLALLNPLVILLGVLALLSAATGDLRAAGVMGLMVGLGVTLRFAQESKATAAAAKLRAMIKVTATVLRDGVERELPLRELVPGDVVLLSAGDMIPGDARILNAKDLFLIQASLTGESMPVEKSSAPDSTPGKPPLELPNLCFLGTSVDSGSASAVIAATGTDTYLGGMARSIAARQPETSFDRGVNRFTWLMLRFMFLMVPLVFLVNGLTKHNWREAFFFSLAVAVGLTPEMLPMIVSVCLSKGAVAMCRKKVIVKRLSSIQNFGAMDVLCSDKTGTLTQDRVILEKHCDVALEEDEAVLHMAYLISHFQTGLKNVLDRAILAHRELHQHLATVGVQHRRAHHGKFGPHSNEGFGGGTTETVEGGQIGHRLGEVGLALTIETHHGRDARVEVERGGDVVAEVDQLESTDDHGTLIGIRRYR